MNYRNTFKQFNGKKNKKLPFSDMFEMPSDIFYSHDIRIRKMYYLLTPYGQKLKWSHVKWNKYGKQAVIIARKRTI